MALSESTRMAILGAVDASTEDLIGFTSSLIACRTDSQSEGNAAFRGEAERCQSLIADQLGADRAGDRAI